MSFCTQCGTQLPEGQVCECTEAKQFCTECGTKIYGELPCVCSEEPVPEPEVNNVPEPEPGGNYISEPENGNFEEELTVKQYDIAVLRNWLRAARAKGDLRVTDKRVIFSAQTYGSKGRTTAYREFALSEIAGVDAVVSHRFSIPHFVIGLLIIAAAAALTAAVTFIGGWLVTNLFVARPPLPEFLRHSCERFAGGGVVYISQLSLIFGLVAGFGGGALYFVFRRKYWIKPILLGVSIGAFFVVALTGNAYAYALLGASALLNIYGLIMYARLPDLAVSLYGVGGVCVDLLRTKGRRGRTGYAEAAPTPEAEAALCELGEVIAEVQSRV